MFQSKTTGTVKTRKKNIGSFLAILFCTLVIVSSIGTSFGIRNSYAQVQQQQMQHTPTIVYKSPWSNNLQVSSLSVGSQPLCAAGVCSQSSSPATNTPTTNADPTVKKLSATITHTNNKPLTLVHSFTSSKVVGPDRFRFINYYWTSSNTPRAIDVGSSSSGPLGSTTLGSTATGLAPLLAAAQGPNVKQEVDTNEGQNALAIILQYQGVVPLAGVTAALKLPAGFKAALPLTSDPHRYDIALSQYRGTISPGQGITLYFVMNILPTAKVGLPVLGPVALHFLRADQRSVLDTMEAVPESALNKAFQNTTTSTLPSGNSNTTTFNFNDNFDFKRDYFNSFGRTIPFDFINQVIPVIFKVSGQETLDVVTLPYGAPVALNAISTHILKIPNDDTSRIRLAVTNTGDAGVWDMTVNVFPGLQSSLGINGLTPSAISSPNIPQTLFSTILPIGIVGHSTFYLGEIPAGGIKEFDVNVYPTHYVAGTVELLNVQLTYNNVVGTRVWTGTNTPSSIGGSAVCNGPNSNGGVFAACGGPTLNQVYFAIAPTH
jgi:hypothetical protein